MHIYKTTNKINGKIYVGKTINNFDYYLGSGKLLKFAINKYGKENFSKEIIEYCDTVEILNEREIYWIDKLKSKDKEIGYNISNGGQGGVICDIELLSGKNNYINKMSDTDRETHLNKYRRGINYWLSKGFKNSEEINEYIDNNYRGENHQTKRGKTDEEYKNWRKTTKIGHNFIRPDLIGEERTEFFKKNFGGKNNPIYRNKTPEEFELWKALHMDGDNASNAKYEYTITNPEGDVITVFSLKNFCKQNNYKYETLLSLCKIRGKKLRGKFYGWSVTRKLRTDRNLKKPKKNKYGIRLNSRDL